MKHPHGVFVIGVLVTLSNVARRQLFGILYKRRKVDLVPHFEALGNSAAHVLGLLDGPAFLQDYCHKEHGLLTVIFVTKSLQMASSGKLYFDLGRATRCFHLSCHTASSLIPPVRWVPGFWWM